MSAPEEAPRKAGRPPCCSPELAERIHKLRDSGLSLRQIQDVLNAEGVSTPTGRQYWWKSSVDRILKTKYMRALEQEASRRGIRLRNALTDAGQRGQRGGAPGHLSCRQGIVAVAPARIEVSDGWGSRFAAGAGLRSRLPGCCFRGWALAARARPLRSRRQGAFRSSNRHGSNDVTRVARWYGGVAGVVAQLAACPLSPWWPLSRERDRRLLRVTTSVLGDLVRVAHAGHPGANVEELPDAGLTSQVADDPAEECPVGLG